LAGYDENDNGDAADHALLTLQRLGSCFLGRTYVPCEAQSRLCAGLAAGGEPARENFAGNANLISFCPPPGTRCSATASAR
jgi:hypothetical protein